MNSESLKKYEEIVANFKEKLGTLIEDRDDMRAAGMDTTALDKEVDRLQGEYNQHKLYLDLKKARLAKPSEGE